jgi:hypothetical protein
LLGKPLLLTLLLAGTTLAALAVPTASAHVCMRRNIFPECEECPNDGQPHLHTAGDSPLDVNCVSLGTLAAGEVGAELTLMDWFRAAGPQADQPAPGP